MRESLREFSFGQPPQKYTSIEEVCTALVNGELDVPEAGEIVTRIQELASADEEVYDPAARTNGYERQSANCWLAQDSS